MQMVTLKNILRANSASCVVFGFMFLLMPSTIAKFLSTDSSAPSVVISVLGTGLFINGLHLAWASLQPMPSIRLILYFSSGDFLWVLSTVLLMLFGIWITTPGGITAGLLVSIMVGALGAFQIIKRKEMGNT